ncbi:DNA cytosine methyltransferase [Variovorax paradoxus]|uniref:DNA (cytosine-5-)-methyltransferase n=1 Tax=Variovorax paradoxus TaxID=34073 RepID=A0A0H2LWU9_VARPD|nr:DNA cytosine methyltransferase [Variovorax paradoxus]KLN54718.1 modification methylase HhaI [Variovorax paradoxus]
MSVDVADMFAGLGGFSEGARLAGCRVVWAANHWRAAVDMHALNHPETEHACQDLEQADWRTVPSHDVLLASPACQGHSPARGAEKPHHDAQRSTAWAVVSAVEYHQPVAFVAENVRQFATKWVLYRAWCEAMHALGYALAPMVLNAADSGVPQERKRLFVVGTRTKHPITLRLPQRDHVAASSFIDFDAGQWAPIKTRRRKPATLARVAAGRARFGERFVMPYYGSGSGLTGRCLSRPLGTVTTVDRWAVVNGDRMRMLSAAENRAAMGFSDSYRLPTTHKQAVHMLGNAVCPPQARDVINALLEAM